MPKTPTRRFYVRAARCVVLIAALLTLAGCNSGSNPIDSSSIPPGEPGVPGAALPDVDVEPVETATLDVSFDAGQLLLRWEFTASAVSRAGDDARVRLLLGDGAEVDEVASRQRLETEASGLPTGDARLDVTAHRLGWRDTTLTAELVDATGSVIASSEPMPISDALAATTDIVAPAVSLAGERFAHAVAFSADGHILAIAQPAAESIRLLPAQTASTSDLDATDGFPVNGLANAEQLQIGVASFGATIAVWWQARDATASTLAIIEPFGEGWYESARFSLAPLRRSLLAVAADGHIVTLSMGDGRLERFIKLDDRWTQVASIAVASSIGAQAIVADGSYALVSDEDAPLALQSFDPDGRPIARSVLPVTGIEPSTWVAGSSRLAIDDSRHQLALTALIPSDDALAVPSLWLFERVTASAAWQLVETTERAPASADASLSLTFSGAADTDTVLWHWTGASRTAAAGSMDPSEAQPGNALVMLVKSPAVAAFGSAARTSLPVASWYAAFELPRDGATLGDDAPHIAAALTPAGDRLAIAWPSSQVAQNPETAPTGGRDGVDGQAFYPAGHLRLID